MNKNQLVPDNGATELPAAVERKLGFSPDYTEERFETAGWTHQGRCKTTACATCSKHQLDIWRKPYDTGGKVYRYWAIVCTDCKTIVDLSGFDAKAKKALRVWSENQASGSAADPPAAAKPSELELLTEPFPGGEPAPPPEPPIAPGPEPPIAPGPAPKSLFKKIIRALTAENPTWELDPSIELHETWERPVWELLGVTGSGVRRWWTPQAPLERIAGEEGTASHWVDFLVYQPWDPKVHIVEIDGSGHRRAKGIDQARDALVEDSGGIPHRFEGPKAVVARGPITDLVDNLQLSNSTDDESPHDEPPSARVDWPERPPDRVGWKVAYSMLGGKLRKGDPLAQLQGPINFYSGPPPKGTSTKEWEDLRGQAVSRRDRCHKLSSQVFIASTNSSAPPSNDTSYWATVCRKVLQRGERPPVSARTDELLRAQFAKADSSSTEAGISERVLGPAAVHRLGLAVVTAVEAGHLKPGQAWRIDLEDPTSLVEAAAGGILDTLAAIDDVWTTGIVPNEITVGSTTWRRDRRFQPSAATSTRRPDVFVLLDPFKPPHAALPDTTLPAVVVTGAYLPVNLEWLEQTSLERRNVAPTLERQQGLRVLLEDLFGHSEFREGQLNSVLRVLAGLDTAVMLPTGAGKSLIFQLVGLLRPGMTLTVDPLRSLIEDQSRGLNEDGIDRTAALTSETLKAPGGPLLLKGVAKGDFAFVYLTPERLQTRRFRDKLIELASGDLVNLMVVDESHCVSEWGHDFRASYLRLGRNLASHCRGQDDVAPPLLAMTATASPSVRRDMFRELYLDAQDPETLQTPSSHERPNLHYAMFNGTSQERRPRLAQIVFEQVPNDLGEPVSVVLAPRGDRTSSGIVFVPHVNGKFGILKVAEFLRKHAREEGLDVVIDVYSGTPPKGISERDWDVRKREAARRFIGNESTILVATKAFGMGIDKPNIRFTVHYGMPSSIEAFAQESGRAGRDGADSYCYLIATNPDQETVDWLLQPTDDADTRLLRYDERASQRPWPDSDLDHRLYFHYGSFPSAFTDSAAARRMFSEIWEQADGQPGATNVAVARSVWADGQTSYDTAKVRERALVRLLALGIAYDYTTQWGRPGRFDIDLEDFDATSVDKALRELGGDFEPGRGATLEAEIANAPDELTGRIHYHIELMVDILYRNIEPSRIRAIEEMHRLTLGELSSADIKARLRAYLGDGLLASSLESTIRDLQERVAPSDVATVLRTLPYVQHEEREGATAAQLAQTPNHPIALLASAMTQAWVPDGDRDRFQLLLSQAFSALADYVPDDDQAAEIFEWLLDHVRTMNSGRQAEWCVDIWNAWPDERIEVLRDATTSVFDYGYRENSRELMAVLDLRLRLLALDTEEYVAMQVGDRR